MPGKRFSAGAVVVRPFPDGWRYLLLRVYRTWDFPKGRVESRETPLQAAVRPAALVAAQRAHRGW
jgi:bis(5'-nucleosidyl)-tetraphosphatase